MNVLFISERSHEAEDWFNEVVYNNRASSRLRKISHAHRKIYFTDDSWFWFVSIGSENDTEKIRGQLFHVVMYHPHYDAPPALARLIQVHVNSLISRP